MMLRRILAGLVALVLAGCVDEVPTDVGDALLPSGGVLTFEVILPASAFLESDTSFSGYEQPINAVFSAVANNFEGVLDAHTLVRFSLPPGLLAVPTGTTTVIDSTPIFGGGRLVLKLDTLNTTARPIALRAFNTAEPWDESATWTLRADSVIKKFSWTTPGGTRGSEIGAATWTDTDSVVIAVDSQTVALWADSANAARGAIIVSETEGSRSNILSATVHVDARSTLRPDTVFTVSLVPTIRTFVFDPTLPSTFSGIRVGGIPAWRALLRFRSDLALLRIPCVGGPVGCEVRLDSAHLNLAQLILRPAPSPAGFVPEDTVLIDLRTVALSPVVPLERSPIGNRIAASNLLGPDLFRNPAATDIVKLDITAFLLSQTDPTVKDEERVAPVLAVMQVPEAFTFGFATFETAPMLRLVITTPIERRP